jgi:hypothetical protein
VTLVKERFSCILTLIITQHNIHQISIFIKTLVKIASSAIGFYFSMINVPLETVLFAAKLPQLNPQFRAEPLHPVLDGFMADVHIPGRHELNNIIKSELESQTVVYDKNNNFSAIGDMIERRTSSFIELLPAVAASPLIVPKRGFVL